MRRLTPLVLLPLLCAAGCGVPAQDHPESLSIPTPERTTAVDATLGAQEVQIWFVRESHLEPVARPVTPADPHTALAALEAGPSSAEADAGLRTALAPETLRPDAPAPEDGTVTVAVTRGFTGLGGGNQQLAVAQVVWTATQFPGIDGVRFTEGSEALEVPTDTGLTDEPVDRGDYASVAPLRAAPSAAGSAAEPPSATTAPAPASPTRRRPRR